MKDEVQNLRDQLSDVHHELQKLFPAGEKIRRHYKYQNSDMDSTSESFIINLNNTIGELYGVLCDLDELKELEYEE